MSLEIRHLRYFVAAVEFGTIGKAARSLNISQPGLTRSIRILEDYLKVSLLERGPKGVTPTDYGQSLYTRAKSILAETARTEQEISGLRDDTDSRVTIGALPSQANFILPEATIKFMEHETSAKVRVVQKPRAEINDALKQGEFDFIFSILDDIDDPEISQDFLFFDRPSIIVADNHPALRNEDNLAKELLNYPWVLPRPEAEQRIYINNYYANLGMAFPKVVIECQTTPYLKAVVMESDYIGVLPTNIRSVEERAGYIRSIDLAGLGHSIGFGLQYRTDHPVTRSSRIMMREIANVCQAMKKSNDGRIRFTN